MTARNRTDLINNLSTDLHPVAPRSGVLIPALVWFVLSWTYVLGFGLYLGPLRTGSVESLLLSPQYAFESVIGFIVGAIFCYSAFRESIPGFYRKLLIRLSYLMALVWIACYAMGLSYPALEPSMIGKRAHCVTEAFMFSLPPFIVGYILIYRRFPLNSVRAGILLGISAGMLPSLFMQFSCMYDPLHTLTHHIGPIIVVILAGIICGLIFKKRNSQH